MMKLGMKQLSKLEKEKILSRLFWDIHESRIDFDKLLDEKTEDIEWMAMQHIYRRLLVSCDWYTLLKLMPLSKIKAILNSPVLDRLYPKDLKHRFIYARDVLSGQDISFSG